MPFRSFAGCHARPLLVTLGAVVALACALLLPSARAQAVTTDVLPATGQVSVVSLLGQETIPLTGTATIQRGDPYVDGGVLVVDTEIIALSLSGDSVTGPVTVAESSTRASSGQNRGLYSPPDQFPASTFFDVFVLATVPASPSPTITLHNDTAIRLVGPTLYGWPPQGARYSAQPDPCVPLLPSLPKQACVTSLSFTLGDPPVGGIAELPQLEAAALGEPDASGPVSTVIAAIAAAGAAGVLGLIGVAWWARRRAQA